MIEKPTTKPRLTSEERRASIVEAAIRLFAEKGFRGTTTRELAAAVGVSEPVLYEHFRTKRDLYSAIIDATSQKGAGIIQALEDKYRDTDDDRGFFAEVAQLLMTWYTEGQDFIRLLLFSNLENHELKDLFHERMSMKFLQIVTSYIERRIRRGDMRPVDPALAARAFIGMVAHYALNMFVFKCGTQTASNNEVARDMIEIFLGGLCQSRERAS